MSDITGEIWPGQKPIDVSTNKLPPPQVGNVHESSVNLEGGITALAEKKAVYKRLLSLTVGHVDPTLRPNRDQAEADFLSAHTIVFTSETLPQAIKNIDVEISRALSRQVLTVTLNNTPADKLPAFAYQLYKNPEYKTNIEPSMRQVSPENPDKWNSVNDLLTLYKEIDSEIKIMKYKERSLDRVPQVIAGALNGKFRLAEAITTVIVDRDKMEGARGDNEVVFRSVGLYLQSGLSLSAQDRLRKFVLGIEDERFKSGMEAVIGIIGKTNSTEAWSLIPQLCEGVFEADPYKIQAVISFLGVTSPEFAEAFLPGGNLESEGRALGIDTRILHELSGQSKDSLEMSVENHPVVLDYQEFLKLVSRYYQLQNENAALKAAGKPKRQGFMWVHGSLLPVDEAKLELRLDFLSDSLTDTFKNSLQENHKPMRKSYDGRSFLVNMKSLGVRTALYEALEDKIVESTVDRPKQPRGPAAIQANIFETPEGIIVDAPEIRVNPAKFKIGESDYSDLKPIVIRHEMAELRARLEQMSSGQHGEKDEIANLAHIEALREEYDLAFRLGKADRLLEFATKSTQIEVERGTITPQERLVLLKLETSAHHDAVY